MAVRSSMSMILPMLEHQAQQFDKNNVGVYHTKIEEQKELYDEIRRRLKENEDKLGKDNSPNKKRNDDVADTTK